MIKPLRAACVAVALVGSLFVAGRAEATLPTPSWWNGACDATHWNSVAASKGWTGAGAHALGASYLGVAVCGPRPSGDHAPDVQWTKSGWGEYEWECPELTMRFMALAYGVSAYNANGNNVVRNYTTSYGGNLVKVANGTSGKPPLPGDVVSFDNSSNPAGHAAVVAASAVDSSGNGTVKLISQNDTADGWRTLAVSNWRLASFGSFVPYGWLHDPAGRGGGGTNHPPFGASKATASSGHHIDVQGWTIDPDTPKTPTRVVVIITGNKPAPFRIKLVATANLPRPGVATKYPAAGEYHGFDVSTTIRRAQKVGVRTVALDTADGSRALIRSVTLTVP